jgi:hypothetical protein
LCAGRRLKVGQASQRYRSEAWCAGAMSLPLITVNDEDGSLCIPEATVEALSQIQEQVAIVAVAGPYRSGKSFLMNCLSQAADDGAELPKNFTVGPTVNPCTRGLWLFPNSVPMTGADGKKMRVLFVDSEGLGAVKSSQQHDLHIVRALSVHSVCVSRLPTWHRLLTGGVLRWQFSLALLTSSLFIFNSFGAIDEANIQKLSFIGQLSKHIHIKSSAVEGKDTPQDFDEFFPSFLWVLRDFSLGLKDKKGNAITEREYLEAASGRAFTAHGCTIRAG